MRESLTLTPEERLALRVVVALVARLGADAQESVPAPVQVQASALAGERLLSIAHAASMLGVTPRWLYRHHRQLPFTRKLSAKVLRFSEVGITRWLATRRT